MCCETALAVTFSSAAARTKLPSRALASKALSALSGGSLRVTAQSVTEDLAFLRLRTVYRNLALQFLFGSPVVTRKAPLAARFAVSHPPSGSSGPASTPGRHRLSTDRPLILLRCSSYPTAGGGVPNCWFLRDGGRALGLTVANRVSQKADYDAHGAVRGPGQTGLLIAEEG